VWGGLGVAVLVASSRRLHKLLSPHAGGKSGLDEVLEGASPQNAKRRKSLDYAIGDSVDDREREKMVGFVREHLQALRPRCDRRPHTSTQCTPEQAPPAARTSSHPRPP
jgi:hypothetical protein